MDTMSIAIAAALGIFLSIIFTRWLFQVDARVKNQKAIIGLLSIIAKKNGATPEEVEDILKKAHEEKK